jgi:hypothetical protein
VRAPPLGGDAVEQLLEQEALAPGERGEFAKTDPTLAQLIGRAPKTMRAVLAEELVGGARAPPTLPG